MGLSGSIGKKRSRLIEVSVLKFQDYRDLTRYSFVRSLADLEIRLQRGGRENNLPSVQVDVECEKWEKALERNEPKRLKT